MEATVSALLNQQINKEFYSAYLYLDIANFYASKGLDGFANWYQVQAKEEQDHAMLFYQYLHNNGQPVILEAVGKPDGAFASLEAPLAAALEHERYVTALINAIYTAAQAAQDYRTVQFLDWFVKEQGEEEKNAADLITKMELFGSDAKGLYMLNSELAARAVPCAVIRQGQNGGLRQTQGKSGASGHRVFGKDCDLFFKNRKYAVSLAASDAEERLKFIEFI